jgi:hypothetical protein
MSKLIPEELRAQLKVPLIASSREFQDVWNIQRYLMRMKVRQLLTPEIQKYCDAYVKKKILFDNNEYLGIALHESLKTIISYLQERYIEFNISAYLSKDPYLPSWEGITILIKVPYRNFHNRIRIWREIEDGITKIFLQLKESKRLDTWKIDEANEAIATTVDRLNEAEEK